MATTTPDTFRRAHEWWRSAVPVLVSGSVLALLVVGGAWVAGMVIEVVTTLATSGG